jgi:hypothetical protein
VIRSATKWSRSARIWLVIESHVVTVSTVLRRPAPATRTQTLLVGTLRESPTEQPALNQADMFREYDRNVEFARKLAVPFGHYAATGLTFRPLEVLTGIVYALHCELHCSTT